VLPRPSPGETDLAVRFYQKALEGRSRQPKMGPANGPRSVAADKTYTAIFRTDPPTPISRIWHRVCNGRFTLLDPPMTRHFPIGIALAGGVTWEKSYSVV
jgi:hypothetical protein